MGRREKKLLFSIFFGYLYRIRLAKDKKNNPSFSHRGAGGRLLIKVLYWEAPLRGPTPYPFINHFRQKRYPFRVLYIGQMQEPLWAPNKWYPSQNFVSLVNALSVKYTVNYKPESFLDFFAATIKRICYPLV